MTPCPPADRLAALMADELPPAEDGPVAAHVDGCPACQQVLEGMVEPAEAAAVRPDRADSRPSAAFLARLKTAALGGEAAGRPPVSVPGYDILDEVGRGGMGVVYRARQLSLGRTVALKMLPGWGGPAELARLRAEAAVLAGLSHPHIVQVHEVGEADGRAFVALEYVAGGTLKARCGKPADPAEAAALVRALAAAIHTAHRQGVVHRDLKPANVLLAPDGTPKIGDFGLAVRPGAGADRLTRTGEVVGTPQYMAPEQADGRLGPVAAAADVYALGVILYELLTGRPPFDGTTPVETVRRVLGEDPVSVRRLRPAVPRDLDTIAHKCLQKDPAKRYASADELADDLGRFAAGRPVLAKRVGAAARAGRWGRRNPLAAGLLAALGLALAGGLAGTTALWLAAEGSRRDAERNFADAEASRETAERLLYFNRVARAWLEWRLNHAADTRRLLVECDPTARGWEWHQLKGLTDADLMTVPAAHPVAYALAYTPDGDRLVTGGGSPYATATPGGRPGEVRVWDAAGWRADAPVWEGRGGVVMAVAVRADGRRVAAGGMDGRVRVWNLSGGAPVLDLDPFGGRVEAVAYSPDGRALAVGRWDGGGVRVIDADTGAERYTVPGRGAAFAPGGAVLATCRDDGVHLWDAGTGRPVRAIPGPAGRQVAFSPDGGRVAVGDGGRASVLRADDGRLLWAAGGPAAGVLGFAFAPDGRTLATAGADRAVRVYDAATGTERLVFRGHGGRVGGVAFHPAGRQLASLGQQPGEVKVWDLARNPEYLTAVRHDGGGPEEVEAVGFAAGGRQVVAVRRGGRVQVRDAGTGAAVADKAVGLTFDWLVPADPAAVSPDGDRVAGVTPDRAAVAVWDLATGAEGCRLVGHTVPVLHVSWSGDGRRLVTVGLGPPPDRRREVRVWDAAGGGAVATFTPAPVPTAAGLFGVAGLSHDGSAVAFDDYDGSLAAGRVRVFDLDGRERFTVPVTAPARAATFSAAGRRLAVLDREGHVRVVDAVSGQPLHPAPLAGPGQDAGTAAFSPDGRLLAAVDRDGVIVWHAESGQELLTLRGAPPRPWDPGFTPRLAWSRDGFRLAASNWDTTVSVWDAADRSSPAGKAGLRRAATGAVAAE